MSSQPERQTRLETQIRSWSQLQEYMRCPHAFYLSRIVKAWQKPAAWLPMGTAVHAAGEAWELSERTMSEEAAIAVFKEEYWAGVNALLEVTPNRSYWMNSGPYEGEEDIPRRFEVGQEHVRNLINFYTHNPKGQGQKPWRLPDGRLAIEMPFVLPMGSVQVRGVIDWLGYVGGSIRPRDLKTGAKPGEVKQLKLYALALEDWFQYTGEPREVTEGDFFMTKRGTPTRVQNLAQVTRDEMVIDFEAMDAGVKAGDFPAYPDEEKCFRCPVAAACRFKV